MTTSYHLFKRKVMDKSLAVYQLLKDIFFILEDGERSLFNQYDLTVPRFYTLKNIAENPGISLSNLSTKMLSDKGNISRIVKGMEADGLIVREQHESDGRALCLFLSDAGQTLCDDVVSAHDRYNMDRLSILDGDTELLFEKLANIREYLAENLERTQIAH